jgi:membrane carboxypeptidase/penicillin-binding protein PbpC
MKRLIKIFRNLVIVVSLLILGLYIFLLNSWKIDFTENEINQYISEIIQAEELPNLFYELYNLDTNNSLENGTLMYLTKNFFFVKTNQPLSIWIAKMMYIPKAEYRKYPHILKIELSLATKIDKEISPKEQLNFMLKQTEFANGQIGIKSASKYYFNKEITELNENEIASLIVMTRNPSLYNPKRRPEKLKAEVEKLLNK